MPNLPKTTQEAQDVLYGYYQRTLRELPEGVVLDRSRYGGTGSVIVCDDNASNPSHAPATFNDIRDVLVPTGTDVPTLVAKVGEIWRGWGWRVVERDGFKKPNRFGYTPDGYWLGIENSPPPAVPLTLTGGSPCFPGDENRFIVPPSPQVITRDGPQGGGQGSSETPSPTR